MRIIKTLPLLFLLLVGGCSLLPEKIDETSGMNASELYSAAKGYLSDGSYDKAIDYFGKLEARYPYGNYAMQAQLETAYAHYRADEPEEAVAAADRFIKLHPRNPHVDYAYYLRGLTTFNSGRSLLEKFLPHEEVGRDPTAARQSFNYFKELVTRYPQSRYTKDAVQRMIYLRDNLALYEVKVARFYLEHNSPLAAANRASYVVKNYDRTPAVPQALALMVQAYRKMQMLKLADDALRVLRLNYPNDPALTAITAGQS